MSLFIRIASLQIPGPMVLAALVDASDGVTLEDRVGVEDLDEPLPEEDIVKEGKLEVPEVALVPG